MERVKAKESAKAQVKKYWGILLLALLLETAFSGIASLFGLFIGLIIVTGPLKLGVYYIYSDVMNDKKPKWLDIFKGFKENFGNSMLIMIFIKLISLAIFVPAFIWITAMLKAMLIGIKNMIYNSGTAFMGGYGRDSYSMGYNPGGAVAGVVALQLISIALCVVVIYFLLVYAMAMFTLMMEPDCTALEAMKKSRFMMNGEKKGLFIFYLSFIGWFALSGITFGLLLIWLQPYFVAAKLNYINKIYIRKKALAQEMYNRSIDPDFSGYGTTRCRNCNAELPEGALFCGKCGTKQ